MLAASLALVIAGIPAIQAELNLDKSDLRQGSDTESSEWKKHWAVEEGFSLELDTQGYQYPTAIAFVPNPGAGPKDPLYFVTELRGKVKVVTNDRTIHTFAEGFLRTEFDAQPPKGNAEFGLAGICLEPERGYVFVTFAYQDGKTLRNNILRFETTPRAFALKSIAQQAFTEVFADYEAGVSHHIGGCHISGDMLHVGIGDGWNSHLGSAQLDTLQGKVIRMTLDGEPVPANPFYIDDDIHKAVNFVWAYGLRNPFGLNVIDGKIIVAENGVHADRLLRVRRGKDYLWDGTDRSIATNADYVFLESVGPVQMDYYKRPSPGFPERFENQFYVALSSDSADSAGVMRLPYSLAKNRMVEIPEYVVRSVGEEPRPVTGLAFGPDGLYFVPILPVTDGLGAVLKIKYEPQDAHSVTIQDLNAMAVASADQKRIQGLMHRKGCFGCHRVQGVQGLGGTKGPMLGGQGMITRIQERISSAEFLESLRQTDARNEAPFNRYEEARDQVANAEGIERVRLWVKYQILEPRFDDPFSGMPNLGLTETEAEAITAYLMGDLEGSILERVIARLPKDEEQRLATIFAAGIAVGLAVWFVLSMLTRFMPWRRS